MRGDEDQRFSSFRFKELTPFLSGGGVAWCREEVGVGGGRHGVRGLSVERVPVRHRPETVGQRVGRHRGKSLVVHSYCCY